MKSKNISTALVTALIVGTGLNLINSYDVFFEGNFTSRNVIRIMLTYITPFCVSLYSLVKGSRRMAEKISHSEP